MTFIDLNMDNLQKCICPECSVQSKSECADRKLEKMIKNELMHEETISRPNEIPGLYCATGKSECKDFDQEQVCQCSGCEIWKEYELGDGEPGEYFCLKFKAR